MTDKNQLTEHFFRHSYAKTTAILVRYFGLQQVEIAEDIVQDTLVEAMEQWSLQGIPNNPEGWIMDVAKKKTINLLKRKQLFDTKIVPALQSTISFEESVITDSTLRMIFACCHPSLPVESQIALALKTLCGLSVAEIARALLTTEDNINKRLYRAKTQFRTEHVEFIIPDESEFSERLDNVCKTLYLLFNEGYYSPHHEEVLRIDLCYEAIRLLQEVDATYKQSAKVNGLLSLIFFSLARFESRLDENDSLICLQDQNRSLWDKELIAKGVHHLSESIKSNEVNLYQLQAGIAAEHCLASDFTSTNWDSIFHQYQLLETLDSGFLVKMNKYIAYYFLGNKKEAITSLLSLQKKKDFIASVSYYLTVGTLYSFSKNKEKALFYLHKALDISDSEKERTIIQHKLAFVDSM